MHSFGGTSCRSLDTLLGLGSCDTCKRVVRRLGRTQGLGKALELVVCEAAESHMPGGCLAQRWALLPKATCQAGVWHCGEAPLGTPASCFRVPTSAPGASVLLMCPGRQRVMATDGPRPPRGRPRRDRSLWLSPAWDRLGEESSRDLCISNKWVSEYKYCFKKAKLMYVCLWRRTVLV